MNQITYTPAFANKVKGTLRACFRVNASGEPLYIPDREDPSIKHYRIELSLESPNAEKIDSVTYYIDDPTFEDDPLAVSEDRDNDFKEEIASYGDVEVEVSVQMGPHVYKQRAWLSNLLEAGHPGNESPAIHGAIEDIETDQGVEED